MKRNLTEFLGRSKIVQKLKLTESQQNELATALEDEYLVWFLSDIIREAEEIIGIDPRLSQKNILEIAAKNIVQGLEADAATIRIFDPETLRMTSFGAYGLSGYDRLVSVPVQDSVSGRVVQEKRSIIVPSIQNDPLYKNKDIIKSRGFHSLLAVPLFTPTYIKPGDELLGALQIYYREEGRHFNALEVIHAELLARRVSYVLAKKKILDLQELNNHKEQITDKIFVKLSMREGIKLKDLFVLLIPELGKFLEVKSCSLYTVSDDQQFIHLEAAYPLEQTYHEIGYTFTVRHHPYFEAAILGKSTIGDTPFERITSSYVLIKDPEQSSLISPKMRQFVKKHRIHSFLLVPLKVDERVRHLLTFYATKKRQYFTDEEIELLIFFGKEIMKASRLEFFSDILHDFKNPAIALAGFAKRAQRILESGPVDIIRDKLIDYLKIMSTEASRLQDLALTMSGEGREEVIDMGAIAEDRFRMSEAVVQETKRSNINLAPPDLEPNLFIFCPRFALERVIDNLLSNAIKAIPNEGGGVALRAYRQDDMVCLEISNSGEIPADQIEQVRQGKVKGRGLSIIYRFVITNHGKISIWAEEGMTKIILMLPFADVHG